MTTLTRKEAITAKYTDLCGKLSEIDENVSKLFPSLEDYDIVDLVFFFRTLFPAGCDYREGVIQLASTFSIKINNELVDKMLPLITEYLDWFRQLL